MQDCPCFVTRKWQNWAYSVTKTAYSAFAAGFLRVKVIGRVCGGWPFLLFAA
jgi:hypothetical protein